MSAPALVTVPEAVSFLRQVEVEAIEVGCGWVLRGAGVHNQDWELTLDDDAQLLEHARWEREMKQRLDESLRYTCAQASCLPSFTHLRRGRQSTLEDWPAAEGGNRHKEVQR